MTALQCIITLSMRAWNHSWTPALPWTAEASAARDQLTCSWPADGSTPKELPPWLRRPAGDAVQQVALQPAAWPLTAAELGS